MAEIKFIRLDGNRARYTTHPVGGNLTANVDLNRRNLVDISDVPVDCQNLVITLTIEVSGVNIGHVNMYNDNGCVLITLLQVHPDLVDHGRLAHHLIEWVRINITDAKVFIAWALRDSYKAFKQGGFTVRAVAKNQRLVVANIANDVGFEAYVVEQFRLVHLATGIQFTPYPPSSGSR